MSIFNSEITLEQLKYVNQSGLEQREPYWNFGQFTKLREALPTLRSGLWYHVAPENVGKSQNQINLGYQVLSSNPDAYWLDFTLDDSIERRWSYLLARHGDIPINLILQAGKVDEHLLRSRQASFSGFAKQYRERYRVLGLSSNPDAKLDEARFTAEWVCKCVKEARAQIGWEAKLWITIDGFHDLELERRAEDENSKQKLKSEMLRYCALDQDALFMMTAHPRKDSRRRGMTTDILKGDDAPLMHAMVITNVFSDLNLNRDNAVVTWEEPDGTKMPVHELDILKNKAGSYKGIIFYNFDPRRCLDFEVPEETQQLYRSWIFMK